AGVARHEIFTLKKAYDIIFSGKGTMFKNIENVEQSIRGLSSVDRLIQFIKSDTSRSFCFPKKKQ
ncbi:MAG: hypothetical protein LBF44_01540, partial [Holosporaceae bacterium]|nr:hypothetical protein [Holosporaceae bacterium]